MTGERRFSFVIGLALVMAGPPSYALMDATTECLSTFAGVPDADKNGGIIQCTDCDPSCDADGINSANGSCTFKLKVCADEAEGSCTATELKKVTVKGRCGASALAPVTSGATPVCGSDGSLTVKLTKRGKKAGKCKITAKALSSSKPRRVDKDILTLVCNPRPAGQNCPSTTACTVPSNVTCEPIVPDGQGIPGTYELLAVPGPKICQTNSSQNRFGTCNTDADCGGGQGNCSITPFATADGTALPFPQGIKTTFTVGAADPQCNHAVCLACGNGDAPCAGVPGCSEAGNPSGCIRSTCCDQPGFTIPTFLVPLLGGLCSRLDMYRCGFGVVNTSNPQTGDNEITKIGDTSDPGPDCVYGTSDDPPRKACNTNDTGAGHDLKGKVTRSVGNGACDPNGIQYRVSVPSLSTTWSDGQSPQGTCVQGSIFEPGELKITQLVLNAEFTTAGATGAFSDMNGDGCALAGAGFTNFNKTGPFTLGSPPAAPQAYDGGRCRGGSRDGLLCTTPTTDPTTGCPGGVCLGSIAVSSGIALSGGGPLFDIGFIAILTNGPITRMPTQSCSCSEVPGCPE